MLNSTEMRPGTEENFLVVYWSTENVARTFCTITVFLVWVKQGKTYLRGTLGKLGRGPQYSLRPHNFYIFGKLVILAFIGCIGHVTTVKICLFIYN